MKIIGEADQMNHRHGNKHKKMKKNTVSFQLLYFIVTRLITFFNFSDMAQQLENSTDNTVIEDEEIEIKKAHLDDTDDNWRPTQEEIDALN